MEYLKSNQIPQNAQAILNSGIGPYNHLPNITPETSDIIKQVISMEKVNAKRLVMGESITCSSAELASPSKAGGAKKAAKAAINMANSILMQKASGGSVTQGLFELCHEDIEFQPLFEKCKCDGGVCKPEIEDGKWKGYDESYKVSGGFGLNKEDAYIHDLPYW